MALFAGKLRAQLEAQEDAHMESVEYLAERVADLTEKLMRTEGELLNTIARHTEKQRLDDSHHREQVRRLTEQMETAGHLSNVELARREGQIGELLSKGKLLDLVKEQHEWVRDGQCSSHGVVMDVWKCVHCSPDPMANTRVLLPAGTKWRARDG